MIKIKKKEIVYIKEKVYEKDILSEEVININSKIDFSLYLFEDIEIEEDVILEDIFKFIKCDKDNLEKIFSKSLGHYSLSSFINEIDKKYTPFIDCGKEVKFDCIEIRFYCDYDDYDKKIMLSRFSDVSCIKEEDKEPFGMDWTPLYKIKYLPVRLNKKFIIEKLSPKKDEIFVDAYHEIQLHEFFDALFNEISFYGEPEDRNRFKEKIVGEVEEIRSKIDKGSVKLKNFKELKKGMKQK